MYQSALKAAGVKRPAASLLKGLPAGSPDVPWLAQANIYQRDAANRFGQHDLVLLPEQLFLAVEPERLLERAARIARRRLIVTSVTIRPFAETAEGATLDVADGDMLFAGSLSPAQSHMMDRYWRARKIELEQYRRWPDGFTLRERPDFGVWWWFFTPRAVEKLMADAGFPVVERFSTWRGVAMAFVGERKQ
jgi:hypothetical protein